MSFKFDSMMIILNQIDEGAQVTVQSLKQELGVSERTVHRYLETLQLSGVPIFFDRRRERYAFPEGYSLKKPGLDPEESLALALAKKAVGVMGTEFEERLTRIEKKLAGRTPAEPPRILIREGVSTPGTGHLETLNRAAQQFQRVQLVYRALSSNRKTRRVVEPDYLFHQEGLWYLRAYCCLREEVRTFALDRIDALRVLEEHFVPRLRSGNEELDLAFGSFLDGEPVDVVLLFDPKIGDYVRRRRWHPSQRERVLTDGRVEVRFRVNGLEGIGRWIYRWLPEVEVVGPAELRERMKADLKKALVKYENRKTEPFDTVTGKRGKGKGKRNQGE
jgi:predicted DNA-binding transcriptional regulator YafY